MWKGLFPEYVSVAERQRRAQREVAKLRRKGDQVEPVSTQGQRLASTVWGQAWCGNLERYSDFESRLPRGRAYLRHGQVVDLRVRPGEVKALVSGTELYRVRVKVKPLPQERWGKLVRACAGRISSVVELLRGRLSEPVMEVLCRPGEGLFPTPEEISMSCSCPDYATLCKHVAASLYGVGVRLDTAPHLLFTLRQVDGTQLVTGAAVGLAEQGAMATPTLSAGSDLGALFAIELAPPARATQQEKAKAPRRRAPPKRGKGSHVLSELLARLERLSARLPARGRRK
ncbi:MAG TPA: hypothetical protein VK539_12605 [Myxococcaceae bacterium]|nr:hypothetical protein [Myxococcaceae bacterium]